MQIDYVITWVDGQDPKHKALRKKYSESEHVSSGYNKNNKLKNQDNFEETTKIRFQDNGEIYYNIASVLKYAPFIRKIFIITDNQTPNFLQSFIDEGKCSSDFIEIISHDQIFAADSDFPDLSAARPCFNSRSIEAALWRIQNLSEHFIYSNDDFFINAPVQANDFFYNGKPQLFGNWKHEGLKKITYLYRSFLEKYFSYSPQAGFNTALWRGAKIAGYKNSKYLSIEHRPHPMRKSTFTSFFKTHKKNLQRQLKYRFRSHHQFNPVSLANHIELKNGLKANPPQNITYLSKEKSATNYERTLRQIYEGNIKNACIQDLGLYSLEMQIEIHHILMKKFNNTLPEVVKENTKACIKAKSA